MGRYRVIKTSEGFERLDSLDSPMIGSTDAEAGAGGSVPAPEKGEQDKFLKGDGTWDTTETNFVGTRTQWNKLNLGQKRKFKTADIIKGYLIKYFANGGTGTMPTDEKGIGEVIKIRANEFGHADSISEEWIGNNEYRYHPVYSYSYNSWNTNKEGEGITYHPNDDYVKNESVDLYAQWNSTESGVDTEQYYLTVNKGANMETVSGEAWYDKNTSATASGTAKANYTENTYTVDPNNPGHRYKKTHVYTVNEQTGIVMDEAKTVTVTATDDDTGKTGDQYYLTVRADEHVESYTPSQWSNEGSTINITATAQTGWQIANGTGAVVMDSAKTVDIVTEPIPLKFSSDAPFTLSVTTPSWDGTLEYSTNNGSSWATWDGSALSGTATQPIYIKGTGNTVITNNKEWTFTGKYCTGNIETLLDYQTVKQGQHPTMAANCYRGMFRNCTSLIAAPELPATTLATYCYQEMFRGCSALTVAPALPATILKENCYGGLFSDCISLTNAPQLPATTLATSCYSAMFRSCTALTTAPELPVTTLAYSCYQNMFENCPSLTTAPSLPATVLSIQCYSNMFLNCTALTVAPALPATTLATACYESMFESCTSLTTAPSLPATILARSCYAAMFDGCTSLKLSTTQDSTTYKYAYRIPTNNTGTTASGALNDMFTSTGGTFKGTPTINTTYYTDHQPV